MEQIGLRATIEGVPDFTSGIHTMNKAVDSFANNGKRAGGDFAGGFGKIVTGALEHVGRLAVDALMQAGRAVAGFVKDSIGLAGDFQAGMLEFQSVAGREVDTAGLEKFHDLFLDIGKRLPVSTAEVQKAAIEMVKGGIDPATIAAGGLEQNIQFAAAAMGGDLVKAAEISSKILGGWAGVNATAAEKADFLTHATDLLAKAANASSTDVEGLALGIFNSQGIARTAGVTFDDLTTTLAALAPRFESSSVAGNSLKNMIARLQPTTDPAAQAMMKLGLYTSDTGSAFYDAQGNFVGFEQASQLLQNSLKGLTNEQKAAALQAVFGNDAMGAAAGLAELGAQGYTNMAEALANANGVSEAAALKQQGFNTALDNAKGSVEAMQISIGEKLLPVLTTLLNDNIAPAINALSDVAMAFFDAGAMSSEFGESVGALATALGFPGELVQDIVFAMQDVAAAFFDAGAMSSEFGESIGALATELGLPGELIQDIVFAAQGLFTLFSDNLDIVLGIAAGFASLAIVSTVAGWISGLIGTVAALAATFTAAGGGIAGVVALLGGPVTIAVAAVAGAVALLTIAWQNNWGDIQGKTAAAWAVMQPIFNTAVAWLEVNIPKALKTLATFWENTLLPALKQVGSFFTTTIFPILKDLAGVWLAMAAIEVKALATLWTNVLQPALKAVWDFISGSVIPIFKALFEVNWAIATKAVEALSGLWQKVLQPALEAVGTYITSTVVPAFKSIGDYLDKTFGPILTDAKKWLDSVTGGFTGVSGGVKDVIKWLGDLASSISNLKLPDWLTPGSPTPWEVALRGIGNALQTSVGPGLASMRKGMQEIGQEITDTFEGSDIVDTLTELGDNVMGGFIDGMKQGMKGVVTYIESSADTVEEAFCDAFQACSPAQRMVPLGQSIMQGIMLGMTDALPGLKDGIASISADLASQFEDIGASIQDAIADGFGATASIDRQIAKNLDSFKDIPDAYRQYTEGALLEAQNQATGFLDPTEGAKFFKKRSDQILEYAKLQKDLNDAATEEDKARIKQQMLLINAAQTAEIAQYNATMAAKQSITEDIMAQINALMAGFTEFDLTDEQIKMVDRLATMLDQLRPVDTRANAYANPTEWMADVPAYMAPSQPTYSPPGNVQQRMNGPITNNHYGPQLSMPIYTNNSPAALQQSLAIAGAALP